MQNLYITIEQIPSTPLSQILGLPVELKMENQQPSGSFKKPWFWEYLFKTG